MSVVLLDTTVVSLLHPKKRGSEILNRYAVHMEKQTLALSFQSVAELWNWAENREWGDEARNGLDLFIKRFLVTPLPVFGPIPEFRHALKAERQRLFLHMDGVSVQDLRPTLLRMQQTDHGGIQKDDTHRSVSLLATRRRAARSARI
jgi:hypothetical protein